MDCTQFIYHTVDDNPDTIDYRTVQDHGRFLLQLAAWAANDPTRYSDSGPQALTVEDARDAATLMEGVLGSSELSADERSTAEDLRDTLADIADRGDSAALDELSSTYITAAFFLLFTLTESHPGPVPPPLPE